MSPGAGLARPIFDTLSDLLQPETERCFMDLSQLKTQYEAVSEESKELKKRILQSEKDHEK